MHTRTWIPAVVAVVLACPLRAPAANIGGLAAPLKTGEFAVSTALGYVERDVEDGVDDTVSNRRVLFRGGFGVVDGLEIYGILGLTDAEFDDANFDGGLGGTFGAGVKYGLFHFQTTGLKLVLDVQGEYFSSSDGSKRARQQAYHGAAYLVKEVGAAGRVGYFYPYGGLRLSYARYDDKGIDDFTNEDFVGVFGGADYFVNPNIFFSGEVHLFDETSLYLGVGYRF